MAINNKLSELKNIVAAFDSAVIAFSGGCDSTLLAKVAHDVLGSKALAVTAVSPTYTQAEIEEAKKLADSLGLNHMIIYTNELENPDFVSNPPERCYYCKKELMSQLRELARSKNIEIILDGANADDRHDFRPGQKASKELGVRSPLQEVGLTKAEIRALSRELNLPTWNKPSLACLASRIPYGTKITRENLDRVGKSEEFLLSQGFVPVRVRDYGPTARIEILPDQFTSMISKKDVVLRKLKELGYIYITLDLAGFRSGSMNEVISKEHKLWTDNI
ncbi:ATP-dependent sacrificial sulfur transferase LarE [Thermincola ferriacetica]